MIQWAQARDLDGAGGTFELFPAACGRIVSFNRLTAIIIRERCPTAAVAGRMATGSTMAIARVRYNVQSQFRRYPLSSESRACCPGMHSKIRWLDSRYDAKRR